MISQLRQFLAKSPLYPRVIPFALFLLLTSCQGQFGPESAYWFYLAKTILGAWMIWIIWPLAAEMRWNLSWEGILVGIVVFIAWVGLDPITPEFTKPGTPWNPHTQFGENSALAWTFIITRLVGSGFIVPPLEELFYRSFLYRYFEKQDFLQVPLNRFSWTPFLVTVGAFALSHPADWLAAIFCGAAYQALVIYKGRLGDAITAHAVTNILLAFYVIWRNAWHFW
ncbi:MAG: CAAX prenyl protease-related protein [Verrucomicrobiota bacterium]|nr:CAAX prenyl protease-related protein [Verrucomicrobiota bacterium]